jgi:predicted AAA+ superfamily ATPase
MSTSDDAGVRPWVPRVLDLAGLLARKSHFLLGPRQTGKTSLIHAALPGTRVYDLLDSATYLSLSRNPAQLGEELRPQDRLVVIDEVQRLPELLNEVHRLVETRGTRFLLTGSSARKLRGDGVNLLGGRARIKRLHPLTWKELGPHFGLARALARGLLPSIYFSQDARADLEAYAGLYLQQEVVAEGNTRNVPAFSRFLRVAALSNGTVVNFTNIASDAQVPRTTVYEYFEIVKDTLVVHELPPWRRRGTRKPIVSSKYYFFDVGVVTALQGRVLRAGTPEWGEAFETYLLHELASYADYVSGEPLAFWRTTSGFEVDFIVGDHTAVEAKAKPHVSPNDLKSLQAVKEEHRLKRLVCVSLESRERTVDGVRILPLTTFLDELWGGAYK